MAEDKIVRAAIYLRISLDREMDGLAIERQREDCWKIARDRGWTVVEEYVDQSKSATNKQKRREAYDRMCEDYVRGRFDAIICWDLDRLTRQPRQLEDWIDAAEDHGLRLVTANGEADLDTDAGRLFARVKAAVARSEVERKGKRQHRAHQQRAEMGKPPTGVRPMGYDGKGEIIEDEANVVKLIYKSFLIGASLKAIAAALSGKKGESIPYIPKMTCRKRTLAIERNVRREAEGKPTKPLPPDAPWNPASVLGILRNPRYAGYSTYTPVEKLKEGNRRRTWYAQILRDENGDPIPGDWEPIVDPETWWGVQEKLNDPERITNRSGTERKHLGSGIFLCGECGRPVRSHSRAYRCAGHIMRGREQIDDYVLDAVGNRLLGKDLLSVLVKDESPRVKEIGQDIEEQRGRIKRAESDYDEELIEARDLKRIRDKAEAEIKKLEEERSKILAPSYLGDILDAPDPREAFMAADLARKRKVIDLLCEVTLHYHPSGKKGFDGSDVDIKWK